MAYHDPENKDNPIDQMVSTLGLTYPIHYTEDSLYHVRASRGSVSGVWEDTSVRRAMLGAVARFITVAGDTVERIHNAKAMT